MFENSGSLLPLPVLTNPLKHHAGYITDYIKFIEIKSAAGVEKLKTDIKEIGKSQMDLYTGHLSLEKIAEDIKSFLKSNHCLEKKAYVSWINSSGRRFRTITITDGSKWILLPGNLQERWVHIHPARYSPFTLRVRSETLKTVIAVLCYCKNYGLGYPGLNVVNRARINLLHLSPMKEISPEKGTGKLIRILSD